ERHGHRRGHRARVRTGEGGGNRDGRKIHIRKVAHRQALIAEYAKKQDGRYQKRCHYGEANKWSRNIHCPPPFEFELVCVFEALFVFELPCEFELLWAPGKLPSVLAAISTFAPGLRRICPSVTTVSPSLRPSEMTASLPIVRSSTMFLISTV